MFDSSVIMLHMMHEKHLQVCEYAFARMHVAESGTISKYKG